MARKRSRLRSRSRSRSRSLSASPPAQATLAVAANTSKRRRLYLPPLADPRSPLDRYLSPEAATEDAPLPPSPDHPFELVSLDRDSLHALNAFDAKGNNEGEEWAERESMAASSKASANTTRSKLNEKLMAYDIYARREDHVAIPECVQALVSTIKQAQFPTDHERSPNAGKIVERADEVFHSSESRAIALISDMLLGLPAEDLGIHVLEQKDFVQKSVPRPARYTTEAILSNVMADMGAPANPRPDITFGYRGTGKKGKKLFDQNELDMLRDGEIRDLAGVCPGIWFPFLSVEWKSNYTGGNTYDATLQNARSGAAVCHSLQRYFLACGREARDITEAETAHFTVGIDGSAVHLNAHWRRETEDGLTWECARIKRYFLDDEDDMSDFRTKLHHIFRHAVGARFDNIHAAFSEFVTRKQGLLSQQLPASSIIATPNLAHSQSTLPNANPASPATPRTPRPRSSVIQPGSVGKTATSRVRLASERTPPSLERNKLRRVRDSDSEDELTV